MSLDGPAVIVMSVYQHLAVVSSHDHKSISITLTHFDDFSGSTSHFRRLHLHLWLAGLGAGLPIYNQQLISIPLFQ